MPCILQALRIDDASRDSTITKDHKLASNSSISRTAPHTVTSHSVTNITRFPSEFASETLAPNGRISPPTNIGVICDAMTSALNRVEYHGEINRFVNHLPIPSLIIGLANENKSNLTSARDSSQQTFNPKHNTSIFFVNKVSNTDIPPLGSAAEDESKDVKLLAAGDASAESAAAGEGAGGERMGLFKRFHHTYKQYGKVLVVVHCATSTVWAAVLYYVARR